MKEISATKFKAQCLKLLDELEPDGLVVTKWGKPVARVMPHKKGSLSDLIGCMAGEIKIKGDIQSTGRVWNAKR